MSTATGKPWRAILATWPEPWREKWGLRANELEEAGTPWGKAESRAYSEVARERRAARDAAPVELEPPGAPPDFDAVLPGLPEPAPWRCTYPWCFHKTGWWLSRLGVINCLSCCPPSFPGLVVRQGTLEDAPIVPPELSTTPIGTTYETVAPARPPARSAPRRAVKR